MVPDGFSPVHSSFLVVPVVFLPVAPPVAPLIRSFSPVVSVPVAPPPVLPMLYSPVRSPHKRHR